MRNVGIPSGAVTATATAVNDRLQVVADATSGRCVTRPYLWSASTGWVSLNSLLPLNSGWVLETATGINWKGQIVASR
jgi:hypothetical protein